MSASGSRSHARSSASRRSCSPTSRPATSTAPTAPRSSRCSRQLNAEGATIVVITHDRDLAGAAARARSRCSTGASSPTAPSPPPEADGEALHARSRACVGPLPRAAGLSRGSCLRRRSATGAGLLSGGPSPASADASPSTSTPACPTYNPPDELTLVGGTPQTAKLDSAFALPVPGGAREHQRLPGDERRRRHRDHLQRPLERPQRDLRARAGRRA